MKSSNLLGRHPFTTVGDGNEWIHLDPPRYYVYKYRDTYHESRDLEGPWAIIDRYRDCAVVRGKTRLKCIKTFLKQAVQTEEKIEDLSAWVALKKQTVPFSDNHYETHGR